jgi:mRNA interferase MazF
MPIRRGDVVTVAASGDFGKPRPAVVVRSDAFPERHVSVIVCQMTTQIVEAVDFRVTVEPTQENGLRARSQVMADKPVTIRRSRIGDRIGRLAGDDMARVNFAVAFAMGLAD